MLQANQLEGAYWPSLGRLFTFAFSNVDVFILPTTQFYYNKFQ